MLLKDGEAAVLGSVDECLGKVRWVEIVGLFLQVIEAVASADRRNTLK